MLYGTICDPVHGIMEFEEDIKKIIKPIIDTRYFQRLRHIKQLSFVEYVYPGAVHTRFNHCIGAAYLATRVGAKMLKLSDKDSLHAIVVAALLHDIGHGPFSHAFENIYGKNNVSHEDWTIKFIDELAKEFNGKGKAGDIKKSKLIKLIRRAKQILKVNEKTKNEDKFLHQIISSQLDVDRFDYLLRDSHFCGVSYGHFDLDWLISCMERDDGKIVVIPKGVRSVEHYIMARRLMNHNVYYHKKKCAAEYLLKVFFERLRENTKVIKGKNLFEFVRLTKQNKNNKDFSMRIVKDGFSFYSKLTDDDIWTLIKELASSEDKLLKELSDRFLTRKLPQIVKVKDGSLDYVKKTIQTLRAGLSEEDRWRIDYEEPKVKTYDTKDEEIYVVSDKDKVIKGNKRLNPYYNVLEHSDLLKSFSDKGERIGYVYFCKKNKNKHIDDELKKLYKDGCIYRPDLG